jgi:hypothetical protein
MIESKEKVIEGAKYYVSQFPARRALKLKTRLVKLLAPSLFTMAGKGGNILDAELGSDSIGKAVNMLVERLDENDLENLIMELLCMTRREGKEITPQYFDMVYAGNFQELYEALYFVLEVNFGSFFTKIGIGAQDMNLVQKTDQKNLEN